MDHSLPKIMMFAAYSASFRDKLQLATGQDDDVSTVLKGVSTASLEALNYVDYLNNKYAPCRNDVYIYVCFCLWVVHFLSISDRKGVE